jgi:two-component system, chemotaxis family, sensor kinase CheA
MRTELLFTFASEAVEHCAALESAVLAAERGEANPERVRSALRAAHTLKGDAQTLALEAMAELAHALEDQLLPLQSGGKLVEVSQMLRALDALRACLPALEQGVTPDMSEVLRCTQALRDSTQDSPLEPIATSTELATPRLRLSLELLDDLINCVGELDAARRLLRARIRALPRELRPSLLEVLERIDKPAEEIESLSLRARMVPLGPMLEGQARVVRDAAVRSSKRAQLLVEGGDIELDAALIERLRVSLVHIIRNAIDHGIEPAEARKQAGKPEAGLVKITATRQGKRIAIEVLDDGAGLNLSRIEERALELGWLAKGDEPSQATLQSFVLRAGFSTAMETTELSGRGVGLDAVTTFVHELGGSVELQSYAGYGVIVKLLLPVTAAIIDGLQARAGDINLVLPVDAIERCVPYETSSDPQRWSIADFEGETIACLWLADLFASTSHRQFRQALVVARHRDRHVGLVVDRVDKMGRVLMKPVSGGAESAPGVAGSALTEDGKVALVLDVRQLLDFAMAEKTSVAPIGFET